MVSPACFLFFRMAGILPAVDSFLEFFQCLSEFAGGGGGIAPQDAFPVEGHLIGQCLAVFGQRL